MTIRSKQQSPGEAIDTMFSDGMLDRRTAIPAVVTKVNTENSALITIDARPVIHKMITDDTGLSTYPEEMPIIWGIPFVMPFSKAAGLLLSVPINVGDEVLLIFADRSLDNWQFTGKPALPAEKVISRTHDLTDAIAIPGIFNNITAETVNNYSSNTIGFRNVAGSISVTISGSNAIIKVGGNTITVDSGAIEAVCGSSTLNMTSSSVNITATNIELNGNITLAGPSLNIATTTSTTSGGDIVTSGGVNLGSHVHSDPHGGNTGPPQN